MRTFTSCAAAVVIAVGGLAGCGSNENTASPSTTSTVDLQKMQRYQACMKSAGVDIPKPAGPKDNTIVTLNTADPKNYAALTACARYAPPVDRKEAPSAGDQARALKLAECLRKHGIKAKDPATDSTVVEIADGVTYSPEQLTTAYALCNQEVPAASHSAGGQ